MRELCGNISSFVCALLDQVDGQPLLPKLASVIEAKAGTRLSLMHIELGAERVHNADKRPTVKIPELAATPPHTRGRSKTFGSSRDRERIRKNTPNNARVARSKSKARKHQDKVLHERQQTAPKSASKSKNKRGRR